MISFLPKTQIARHIAERLVGKTYHPATKAYIVVTELFSCLCRAIEDLPRQNTTFDHGLHLSPRTEYCGMENESSIITSRYAQRVRQAVERITRSKPSANTIVAVCPPFCGYFSVLGPKTGGKGFKVENKRCHGYANISGRSQPPMMRRLSSKNLFL